MDNHIKISLQDFYDYLISGYKEYSIYCDTENNRYWIIPIHTDYSMYIEYITTTLIGDSCFFKVSNSDTITELLPMVRKEKINKILNR